MSITIFLADDHRLVRDGFRILLETQSDLQVIGVAGNGREAVRQVIKLIPDIVPMDIGMPELNGIEFHGKLLDSLAATHRMNFVDGNVLNSQVTVCVEATKPKLCTSQS